MEKRTYFLTKKQFMAKMGLEQTIVFDEIGRILFRRKSMVKNLTLSVKPFRGVQVLVPDFISFEDAGRFVRSKKEWIKRQQVKIAAYESGITLFNKSTVFKTHERTLRLHTHEKSSIRTTINREYIDVLYPGYANIRDHRIQHAIRIAIVEAWRLEAKKILPPLVEFLAGKYNFHYNRVTIRNNRTRWGSCSRNNNLSLNLHLIRLPGYLCEYVILHELAHTVHKNHRQAFWGLLNKVTGNAKKLDKELSTYKIEVW